MGTLHICVACKRSAASFVAWVRDAAKRPGKGRYCGDCLGRLREEGRVLLWGAMNGQRIRT